MKILEPTEDNRVERLSSIYQHKHMLAVRHGSGWLPIAFDVLDGIVCDKIRHHQAIVTDKPYIGYTFPVKHCCYLSQNYILSDQKGTELKVLPEWYGAGFYESKYDRDIFVNSNSGALGVTNKTNLTIGLDYCLAKKTLDATA